MHVGWGDPDLYLERGNRIARARTRPRAILRYILTQQADYVVDDNPFLYCVSLHRLALTLTLALTHQPEGSAIRTNEKGALEVTPGAAQRTALSSEIR